MQSTLTRWCLALSLCAGATISYAQTNKAGGAAGSATHSSAVELTTQPTLFVVPYAHLDTQWRWDYPTTIKRYLPSTMRDNFALFEKYPHYVFNFSGANRYRMMQEYYPSDYAKVKQYVAAGRWFPSGSAFEESDVNSPNAESIVRQILYGTHYFRREFGKTSAEYMLPDCFGFPASLPSILSHMGLKGFSTQKLSWHSGTRVGGYGSPQGTPAGIPFNVGYWKGLDGNGVVAALNATNYTGDVIEDLTKSELWSKRVQANGKSMGLFADFRYYGTGDIGGAPREASVAFMDAIVNKGKFALPNPSDVFRDHLVGWPSGPVVQVGDGPLRVVQTTAERMFLDIQDSQIARMPLYEGDLELTEHSAGSLTSQAYMKKWNRRNEVLADAAERASVAAAWLGRLPYPQERLNNAWTLVLGAQFHDIIPGTSLPKAYQYSWNDELLASNQFSEVVTSATEAVAVGLNTQVKGTPVVVYNPLNVSRQDVVEAAISFSTGRPEAVRVFGPEGNEVPAQLDGDKVLFLASMPSLGFVVYDVQPANAPAQTSSLKVTKSSIENARYRVDLNDDGDIVSMFDRELNRELLSAPARLALKTDNPTEWPAWNMDWADQQKPPRAYVGGPAQIRIVERGPARVALEISREAEGSHFVQTIRLSAGEAGNRIEFANAIDWHTAASNLKAVFPLTASNPLATYNWDIGTIQRGNNDDKKFEVGSHQWFDLTDKSGAFGVTILAGAKYGSDKPNDNTLGLTLLRTPGVGEYAPYDDQSTQDWGHHEFIYGVASHRGDWRHEQTDWQALRLDTPLLSFQSSKHPGVLGASFSLLTLSNPRVRVMALKKAEDSNEIILRMVELDGKSQQNVRVTFAAPVISAHEVNGQELLMGRADLVKGDLVTSFGRYQPRTFALKLASPALKLARPKSIPVPLAYERSVATPDGRPSFGAFDAAGRALPAEMVPDRIPMGSVEFKLGSARDGKPNAIDARGQTITLPPGKFSRAYLLAASAEGDRKAVFKSGGRAVEVTIPAWTGFIGQWDDRKWRSVAVAMPPEPAADDKSLIARNIREIRKQANEHGIFTKQEFAGLTPGFVKPVPIAWFASHRHDSDGANEPYQFSYLFAVPVDLDPNSSTLTLPNDERLRILAVSVVEERETLRAAHPLYDMLHVPGSEMGAGR